MRIPVIENYDASQPLMELKLNKVSPIERQFIVLNEKDKLKLIKTVERIVRRSIEYKQYIKFLKDEIDMTCCSYFQNISNKTSKRASIEIHHEPFTLFDITQTVVEEFIHDEEELDPLAIAERVMRLHYQNKVGLIPLSATVHQLTHDGKLFIPLQSVYGDYIAFLEDYGEHISGELQDLLQLKIKMSKNIHNIDTSILNKKYVYLTVDGYTFPQIIDDESTE